MILVVEDERHLAEGIAENLQAEGHQVTVVGDGDKALEVFAQGGVELVVLDVMLPRRDGFAVCAAIRQTGSRVPILFLTAKNSPDDRVRGLELGGDDYLGKPFDLRELLLRISGMLRRQNYFATPSTQGEALTLNGCSVNFKTYEFRDSDGRVEILPQKEIMILKLLVEHRGEVVSRDDILDRVWGYDVFPSTRTIDNFIVRLRKRFEVDAANPRHFHTIRGVGYRFTGE